ncbi:hypothetical protein A0H81_12307 [Grifola frondosa]|uniref:Uncharacterized protein n=1 Tax=Grifola frondosa TaxID=5627 RepID=A0A1C7LSV8_GRIFR|nr:hypothetical protein A0H81_12307 [Grifola frondosa]
MATNWRSINSLRSALDRIQIIERRIASTNGQLTKEVFSQSHIGNDSLDVDKGCDVAGEIYQVIVIVTRMQERGSGCGPEEGRVRQDRGLSFLLTSEEWDLF